MTTADASPFGLGFVALAPADGRGAFEQAEAADASWLTSGSDETSGDGSPHGMERFRWAGELWRNDGGLSPLYYDALREAAARLHFRTEAGAERRRRELSTTTVGTYFSVPAGAKGAVRAVSAPRCVLFRPSRTRPSPQGVAQLAGKRPARPHSLFRPRERSEFAATVKGSAALAGKAIDSYRGTELTARASRLRKAVRVEQSTQGPMSFSIYLSSKLFREY